jgi:ATP-binding cassette subfamily B (MDR/TAP) protein 8
MISRLTISFCVGGLITQRSKFKTFCDYKPIKFENPLASKLLQLNDRKTVFELSLKLLGKQDYILLSSILVITFTSAAISIYTPAVIGNLVTVIQGSISTGNVISLNEPAWKLLTLFAANGILTWIDIALVTRLGESIAFKLKRNLFNSILHKEMQFFDSRMNGEITSRLNADVSEFKHTFKIVLTQGLKATAQIAGSVCALANLSSNLTLTLLTTLPPLYIFMNYYGSYLRKLSRNSKLIESDANSTSAEAIQNIKTVRAFQAEDLQLRKYCNESEKTKFFNNLLGFHIGIFQGMTNAGIGSMILLILYYGGNLVQQGRL